MRSFPYALQVGIFFSSLLLICVPFFVSAQGTELQQVIRAALLADERTALLPPNELDALVASLSEVAAQRGITAYDIQWRPDLISPVEYEYAAQESLPSECGPGFSLCALSEAFGFSGSDRSIPIALGILSAVLILILSALLEMHHLKAKAASKKVGAILETQATEPVAAPAPTVIPEAGSLMSSEVKPAQKKRTPKSKARPLQ